MNIEIPDHLLKEAGLRANEFGNVEVVEKPSQEELENYYRDKYYQTELGSYLHKYDPAELNYILAKIEQKYQMMVSNGWISGKPNSLLDVGCGEGHALKYFLSKKWEVLGLDYSREGCERFHPDCLRYLKQGDIYENLQDIRDSKRVFDVIMLDNVLEHVLDPLSLLGQLRNLLSESGILIVDVPNDFSQLQLAAIKNGWIDIAFWVCPPEHLTYFNHDGLKRLCEAAGYQSKALLGDFPIDWNLANPNSNYVGIDSPGKGTSLGKGAHGARVMLENLIHDAGANTANAFFEALAGIGMGRNISGFFTKRPN